METFLNLFSVIATAGTDNIVAITSLTIAVAAYFQAIRILRARVFTEYTKRFSDIETELLQIVAQITNPESPSEEQLAQIDIVIRKYLNLCSEEYHLFKKGLIEKEVWIFWCRGMNHILNIPTYKTIVFARLLDYEFIYPEFKNLIEYIMKCEDFNFPLATNKMFGIKKLRAN